MSLRERDGRQQDFDTDEFDMTSRVDIDIDIDVNDNLRSNRPSTVTGDGGLKRRALRDDLDIL